MAAEKKEKRVARDHRLHIRFNDDEIAVVKANTIGEPADWYRECLIKYGAIKQTLSHYYNKIDDLEKQIKDMESDARMQKDILESAQSRRRKALEERNILQGRVTELEKAKESIQGFHEADEQMLHAERLEKDELRNENVELQKKLERVTAVGEEFAKDKAWLQERVEGLELKLHEANQACGVLRAASEAAKATRKGLQDGLDSHKSFWGWLRWRWQLRHMPRRGI